MVLSLIDRCGGAWYMFACGDKEAALRVDFYLSFGHIAYWRVILETFEILYAVFVEGLDLKQTYIHEDDQLRQLRGLEQHSPQDITIPISSRQGAQYYAEMHTYLRGRPQKIYKLNTVQEFMELEPGDRVQVQSERMGIDSVLEVLAVDSPLSGIQVGLVLTNNRAWEDESGFWTDDPPLSFPASLGGGSVTAWDDTWTDAQASYARQAWGFWTDDNGYADSTDDPQRSYRGSVWFL